MYDTEVVEARWGVHGRMAAARRCGGMAGDFETVRTDAPLPALPRPFARVLVVAAHPDDAEFAFGGTVARLVEAGSRVDYVVVTDGSLGGEDPSVPAAAIAERREREQRRAASQLGVNSLTFLGWPDGAVNADLDLRRALSREIRRHRPDLLLTHQPLRSLQFPIGASHPDHLAVGEGAMSAAYPDAGNPRTFPELLAEGLAPHSVAEIWVPGHEHANFFVALDVGHAERKIEALLCHESQFETVNAPRESLAWVLGRMEMYGPLVGCRYAEGFSRTVLFCV